MTTHPTSRDGRSRPESRASVPPPPPSRPRLPWPADHRLLGLLAEHQVLTSGQLIALTRLPDRTVQHRLGRLYRAGLINRMRPPAPVGTSPYHCWLTSFGAAAIDAGPPEPWSDDPAGMLATAALGDLWLAVRDHGPEAGVHLQAWRRLEAGVDYEDPFTGARRVLPAEAELTVRLEGAGGQHLAVLVVARATDAPVARLQAVLARFAAYLHARRDQGGHPVLALVVRTRRHAVKLLDIVDDLAGAPAARRLAPMDAAAAGERIVVGVPEPSPAALATAPAWCSGADRSWRQLADIVDSAAGSGR
jgi:hypothetical protein